eukprot:CAMPEP_0206284606 /NCGR_PEP_ID=MMETSP0047_2-20121206/40863_1 /ASSEMBLY_ACC=CAM_ASM_000192 /TAXON_ID=195065 /ORGANISM="Chroomonas mesostigmatica_cf, Strain CCMP1168" /LENGTH=47 /DNA_ID= /DNA_START= /DNA_END= /DNA_ORIENTATION=
MTGSGAASMAMSAAMGAAMSSAIIAISGTGAPLAIAIIIGLPPPNPP